MGCTSNNSDNLGALKSSLPVPNHLVLLACLVLCSSYIAKSDADLFSHLEILLGSKAEVGSSSAYKSCVTRGWRGECLQPDQEPPSDSMPQQDDILIH